MHKDEPIDLGGFTFCEVFFGSDMARVAPAQPDAPMLLWLAAVDTEAARGLLTLCVCLPHAPVAAEARAALCDASSPSEVANALRRHFGATAEAAAAAVESIRGPRL